MDITNRKKFKQFVGENKESFLQRIRYELKKNQETTYNLKNKKDFFLSEQDIEKLSKEVGSVNHKIIENFDWSCLSGKDYEDIYQESIIALYNYIGRKIECTLHTLFYNICYRQTLKHLRSKNKIKRIDYSDTSHEDDFNTYSRIEKNYFIPIHKINQILQVRPAGGGVSQPNLQPDKILDINLMKDLVHRALDDMAGKCRQLLTKYYIEGYNWTEIAKENELKDALSAKANAYRCRRRFEEKYRGLRNFVKSNKKYNA